MEVKLIRAFIASPGGLEDERQAARIAAEEVDRSVARPLGFRIELIGWEETISGNGRPQAKINAEMETCDLFIGAMATKWGSRPSVSGPYTSGFEEEFELSLERHKRTGSPEMAMFFRDVNRQQIDDAGPELGKVLAFRKRLIEGKEILFQTFNDHIGFGQRVREFLTSQLVLRHRQNLTSGPDQRPRKETDAGHEAKTPLKTVVDTQSSFLSVFGKMISIDPTDIAARDVARLRLIAAAQSRHGNDDASLGIHDANLLYLHKKEIDLSAAEIVKLAQVGLEGLDQEVVPLWTWLGGGSDEITKTLSFMTSFGSDPERRGAISVLGRLNGFLADDEFLDRDDTIKDWFDDGSQSLKRAALAYLRDQGLADDLQYALAEIDSSDSETRQLAVEVVAEMKWRSNEREALIFLLGSSFENLASDLLDRTLVRLDTLSSALLTPGLDHRSAAVRARTVSILAQRGELRPEIIARAADDRDGAVRAAAVKAMDISGVSISIDEARRRILKNAMPAWSLLSANVSDTESFKQYRAERFRREPISVLELTARLEGPDREAAYLASVNRRFSKEADSFRACIDDRFKHYVQEHWPNGVPETAKGLLSLAVGRVSPDEAKSKEIMSEAVDVLADKRELQDLARIRSAIDDGSAKLSLAVIGYFAALGNSEDIRRLSKAPPVIGGTSNKRGTVRRPMAFAARTIIKLLGSDEKAIPGYNFDPLLLSSIIYELAPARFATISDGDVIEMLFSPQDVVRRAAAIAAAIGPKKRLKSLLSDYFSDARPTYYNVIHWLDMGLSLSPQAARRVAAKSTE